MTDCIAKTNNTQITYHNKEKILDCLKEYNFTQNHITSEYNNLKYDELYRLCKEKMISGYKSRDCNGKNSLTREKMIILLEEGGKQNLLNYLTENNPQILVKFVGNIDNLKTFLPGTNKKFTWRCDKLECKNTFEAVPMDVYRTTLHKNARRYCINCSREEQYRNKQFAILKRSGSIASKFIFVTDIWSDKNIKTPNDFSPGSNEKVKLKCPNISLKHEDYEIAICKIQEHNQFRCPKCITKSSNAEMRIYSELKQTFKDVRWQQKIEGREADITIEDLKLVIEIDGYPWHKDKSEKDLVKNTIFEKNGYNVLRIRDTRLGEIECDTIVSNLTDLSLVEFNKIIDWINIKFNCNTPINHKWKNIEYYKEIQASIMYVKYEESIECLFPESKELWDYEKNHPFIPSQLSKGSDMEMWIKCNNGHSWKRILSHLFRTIKGKKHIMNCPECHKPKSNKTSLQINGKIYKSISECCRDLNIDRNILYQRKDADIQKIINDVLNIKGSV